MMGVKKNEELIEPEVIGIPIPDSGNNRRRKKKRKRSSYRSKTKNFDDIYELTGQILGEGAYAQVQACKQRSTGKEFAVKVITKKADHLRSRVFREVEIYYFCQGHKNILQLLDFYEEEEK